MEIAMDSRPTGIAPDSRAVQSLACHACRKPFDMPTTSDEPWCAHCVAYRNRYGVPLQLAGRSEEAVFMLTPRVRVSGGMERLVALVFPRNEAERRFEAEQNMGERWSCDMRDVNGELWRVQAASCGAPCFCGAQAIPLTVVQPEVDELP